LIKIYKSEEELRKTISKVIPILASKGYLESKSNDYGWFVSENYLLPFIIDKKLIFKRMIFTLECFALKENLTIEDEKKFLNGVVDVVKRDKLSDFIAKAQSYTVFNTFPDASVQAPWGTYEIDITGTDEEILASFNQSHRRALRKALKDGVEVKFDITPEDTYAMVHQTVTRAGSLACPPLEYFKISKENLGDNCLYAGSFKDGKLQNVLTVLFDDYRAYELYGGNIPTAYKGSGQLLKYEAMKYVKEHSKAPIFDLCGARINVNPKSKYAAIQQFKERFKPQLKEGYAFKVVINPLKTKIFNLLVKLYAKRKNMNYVDPIDQLLTGNY